MKRFTHHKLGLSLVELLVAMAILGILLAMLSAFLISNQRVTTTQITAATLSNDLRLAHLRIGEIISQAHYIYPSGQNLTIDGKPFTTGAAALAVLVPRGTTYCKAEGTTATAKDYCGFAYVIEDRTPYVSLLGLGDTTNQVIVEYKVEGLEWSPLDTTNAGKTPAEFLTIWDNPEASPVADSVDTANTNLAGIIFGGTSKEKIALTMSARTGTFDENVKFSITVTDNDEKALVSGVTSTITLERTMNGKPISVTRDNYVFSKAIPRSALPNAPK
jgi:prepilin-type N-terminal cleavage/methylation domain-containing protein